MLRRGVILSDLAIIYFTKTGNTKKMAQAIKEGAESKIAKLDLLDINSTDPEKLLDYQAIIVGSPTQYGKLAAPMNEFLLKTGEFKEKMQGKVGGIFTTYGVNIEGAEITVITVVQILLENGMIVPGYNTNNPFGQIVAGAPDDKVLNECNNYGKYMALLTSKLIS